jgi:hypothetical protein
MKENQKNGWVNISIKYGRSGNPYCELDNFEPSSMSKNGGDMLKNGQNMSKNDDSMLKKTTVNMVDLNDELPF